MEVRIGVTWSSRELEIDLGDGGDADALSKELEAAVTEGRFVWLTDTKGRRVGVPADKVAYVEVGPGAAARRVGFGLTG